MRHTIEFTLDGGDTLVFFLVNFLKLADFLGNTSFPRDCRNARIKQKSATIWINCLGRFRVL